MKNTQDGRNKTRMEAEKELYQKEQEQMRTLFEECVKLDDCLTITEEKFEGFKLIKQVGSEKVYAEKELRGGGTFSRGKPVIKFDTSAYDIKPRNYFSLETVTAKKIVDAMFKIESAVEENISRKDRDTQRKTNDVNEIVSVLKLESIEKIVYFPGNVEIKVGAHSYITIKKTYGGCFELKTSGINIPQDKLKEVVDTLKKNAA